MHIGTILLVVLVIVFWEAIGRVILFTLVAVAVGVALFYSLPTIIAFVGDGSWPYLLGCLLMLWVAVFAVCYCLNRFRSTRRSQDLSTAPTGRRTRTSSRPRERSGRAAYRAESAATRRTHPWE
jgi:hypothetical protein